MGNPDVLRQQLLFADDSFFTPELKLQDFDLIQNKILMIFFLLLLYWAVKWKIVSLPFMVSLSSLESRGQSAGLRPAAGMSPAVT